MKPRQRAEKPTLIAYEVESGNKVRIVPASATQSWMSDTTESGAKLCLPMRMANQSGWVVLNEITTRMLWDGEWLHIQHVQRSDAVVTPGSDDPAPRAAAPVATMRVRDHFGHGVVTWYSPFIMRTSPGYNLLIRGPANAFKDAIVPMEGLVEADWLPTNFPINWRFTRKDVWVEFAEGEPLCQLVPQRRGELESFSIEVRSIDSNPELRASYEAWDRSRKEFHETRAPGEFQLGYQNNSMPDGSSCEEHQIRLRLSRVNECPER